MYSLTACLSAWEKILNFMMVDLKLPSIEEGSDGKLFSVFPDVTPAVNCDYEREILNPDAFAFYDSQKKSMKKTPASQINNLP